MRGRTNYTGGAVPVINGDIERYEVAGGHTVSKGDFVQFTAISNVENILGNPFTIVSKIKISETLYICLGNISNYVYHIYLISLENDDFEILDVETINTVNNTYSYPNIVSYSNKFYVIDTSELKLYEIAVSGNTLIKTEKCTVNIKCPAMAIYDNKIIALGISYLGTSSSSPSVASYEVFTIGSDGSVTSSGSKQVDCETKVYDDIGEVFCKVIDSYIYMIGAWYGSSSTTHGGAAICFKFDNISNTLSYIKKSNVGSSNWEYNNLKSGSFDVIEECGCFFMVANNNGYNGILSSIKANQTLSSLGQYTYPIANTGNTQPYPELLGGLGVALEKNIALFIHNYYTAIDSSSSRNYKIMVELLNFSPTTGMFTENKRLTFTFEELGLNTTGVGANAYILGAVVMFSNDIFYCMISIYDAGSKYTVLLTFELIGTNIIFKGLKKIKKYDGSGFAIGFANSSGSSGEYIDIYVPK